MRFIGVGAGSLVDAERIVAASAPDSAPLKRLVQDAKEEGNAIDLCQGKKCRSVLVLDNLRRHRKWFAALPATVTFDLHDVGIAFFDSTKNKQQYKVNFE